MEKYIISMILGFLLLPVDLAGQDPYDYHSLDEIVNDWEDYTDFQRKELISFCDFLYENEHYYRAIVSMFQFLYRFPQDPLRPVIYYRIARCYELLGKREQAKNYYTRVRDEADSSASIFSLSSNRYFGILYQQGKYDKLLAETEFTDDPYMKVYRGYVFVQRHDWASAEQAFLAAEAQFESEHYSDLIDPMLTVLDSVHHLPQRKKWLALMASILPGGGQAYLKNWNASAGILLTSGLFAVLIPSMITSSSESVLFDDQTSLLIPQTKGIAGSSGNNYRGKNSKLPQTVKLQGTSRGLILPAVAISTSVYVASVVRVRGVMEQMHREHVAAYVDEEVRRFPVDRFMDYEEPQLVEKK